jgi:hypothetical protein
VLDAMPDRIDIRDWVYQPTLAPLPDVVVNCDRVPRPILDQGQEGACTGYALAAVVNYLLSARGLLGPGITDRLVSPRMIYDLARRYDEWPGEQYEGSSARGAMKGWVAHGVCSDKAWPKDSQGRDKKGAQQLSPEVAENAKRTPGGAYFRVTHRNIRDMHAALNEVGILYATLMVHAGWDEPGVRSDGTIAEPVEVDYSFHGNSMQIKLPVIQRIGRADGGHAIAIVGYTHQGFIIQNSWGDTWGGGGFALLPYEDYMLHSTDVWVAQLGVPVAMDLWTKSKGADTLSGLHRATEEVPLADIRPFVIDVGNNGELSDSGAYWTTEADLDRMFKEVIPDATRTWKRRRILLYLHGGLNGEKAVAKRVVAFRDVLLKNEVYPVHIMWESGIGESLMGMIKDLFTDNDEEAARAAGWLDRFRDGLREARDRAFELTAAVPGGGLWSEMKENAARGSDHRDGQGGMQLIRKYASQALAKVSGQELERWELHVVGHSAGSIFAAHAINHLLQLRMRLRTLQFMAPAIRTELFRDTIMPLVEAGKCPQPTVYNLSDVGERDDDLCPAYGKSLLYLVSNAFEKRRGVPLLGMETYINAKAAREGSPPPAGFDPGLDKFFGRKVNGLPSLVIAGADAGEGSRSQADAHGAFDNDPDTMNSILFRILGRRPDVPFTARDLAY